MNPPPHGNSEYGPGQNIPDASLPMPLYEMRLVQGVTDDGDAAYSFQFAVVGSEIPDGAGTANLEIIPIAQGLAMLELAKLDFVNRWRQRGIPV